VSMKECPFACSSFPSTRKDPTHSCCFSFRSTRRPAGGCTTKNAMMRLCLLFAASIHPLSPSSRLWRLTELRYGLRDLAVSRRHH
jgi:hypothetical protein